MPSPLYQSFQTSSPRIPPSLWNNPAFDVDKESAWRKTALLGGAGVRTIEFGFEVLSEGVEGLYRRNLELELQYKTVFWVEGE
jgi:hypothetical protein